jgi:hypothetical protein
LITSTSGTSGWVSLLTTKVQTLRPRDLAISGSFEIGLYTQGELHSKGHKDTSTASVAVQVQVLVDGNPAAPGTVTYGARTQTLSSELEGFIAGCLVIDGSTVLLDQNCVGPETNEAILSTLDAASFDFASVDIPAGVHTITVQARVTSSTSTQEGSAQAQALVGKGALTVGVTRVVRDPNAAILVD